MSRVEETAKAIEKAKSMFWSANEEGGIGMMAAEMFTIRTMGYEIAMNLAVIADALSENKTSQSGPGEEEAEWIHGDEFGDGRTVSATSFCCSKCGWAWADKDQLGFFSHCPNCKVKMRRRT